MQARSFALDHGAFKESETFIITSERNLIFQSLHSLAIDSLETISSDRYELFCHPELLLLKTAFGPAFCEGYTMHQRYVYFLRTMSRVVEYFSDRMGDQQAIEDFPMCHLLYGRLVKMFAGT